MISRQWVGIAKKEEAQRYIDHLHRETFPHIRQLAGFRHASILRRAVAEGDEFLVVTVWESLDAIKQFAGDDPEIAVVPEFVQRIMVRYDKKVRHYAMVEETS